MASSKKKIWIIFASTSLVLAALFFLFPINLFDGVIIEERGDLLLTHHRPLSLSYFIGMGYDEADMEFIKDFYLTTKGIIMAVIFILGLPGLLAYRMYLKSKSTEM